MRKKMWCYFLAFCMVLGWMPVTVLAADDMVSVDGTIKVGTEEEFEKALKNTDNWYSGSELEIILTEDITLTKSVQVKSEISYTLNIPEEVSLSLEEEGRIIYSGTKDFTIKGGGELFTNESIIFSSITRSNGSLKFGKYYCVLQEKQQPDSRCDRRKRFGCRKGRNNTNQRTKRRIWDSNENRWNKVDSKRWRLHRYPRSL